MKICLYSPYLPNHFGGGEKYLFDVAKVLSENHQVSVAISNDQVLLSSRTISTIKKDYENFLGFSLKNIEFISTPIGTSGFFLNKLFWTKKFDVIYYQTDGSLFFSLANKNILHIQVPLKLNKSSLIEKLKLINWGVKNANSNFTKNIVEKFWKTKIHVVHHPMLSDDIFLQNKSELLKKEKIILHVGRFFKHQHSKKQEVLVDIFSKLIKANPKLMKGWKLIFVGSVEDKKYLRSVQKLSKNLPIEIHNDVSREKLLNFYKKASIYWHATGFGVNEESYPEKMEHFGISTAEAMASGCVPIVIKKGGQPEVLGDNLKELLWNDKAECVAKTIKMIDNKESLKKYQLLAMEQSKIFGKDVFSKKLEEMLG